MKRETRLLKSPVILTERERRFKLIKFEIKKGELVVNSNKIQRITRECFDIYKRVEETGNWQIPRHTLCTKIQSRKYKQLKLIIRNKVEAVIIIQRPKL